MASERVLTRRELNRALLARQLLLDRKALGLVKAVERLGGLQAQSTTSPYLSLWTRLEGFERDQLVRALERRRLVKAIIQRGTLHIVTPSDYWAFVTARRELGGIVWPPSYEARLPTARLQKLAASVAAELEGVELTFKEVQRAARALREARGARRRSSGAAFRATRTSCTSRHRGSGGTAATACTRLRRGRSPAGRHRPRRHSTSSCAAISPLTARRRSRTSGSGPASRASRRSPPRWSGSRCERSATSKGARSTTCRGRRCPMPTRRLPCD